MKRDTPTGEELERLIEGLIAKGRVERGEDGKIYVTGMRPPWVPLAAIISVDTEQTPSGSA